MIEFSVEFFRILSSQNMHMFKLFFVSPSRIPPKHTKTIIPMYRAVFRVETFLINLSEGPEKTQKKKLEKSKKGFFCCYCYY